MRAARISFAWIILTSFFLLALRESRYASPAFGQAAVPAAGPSVPVVTLPAAPGAPQPFATIGALPQLMAAPHGVLSPTPTPAATQSFRCACNGPGFPNVWAGTVSAASLLIAEQQTAPSTCTSYLINANAGSPYRSAATSNLGSASTVPLPGTLYSFPPGQAFRSTSTQLFLNSATTNQPLSAVRQLVISESCQRCSCD